MENLYVFEIPKNLISNIEGYEFLSSISIRTWKLTGGTILLNFIGNDLFDANLCSPLGVLIDELRKRGNTIHFSGLQEESEKLFIRNGFYALIDEAYNQQTAIIERIEYRKFHLKDTAGFQLYINESLLYHEDFPKMSELLSKKINKSLLEIFNNAHLHGKSDYIYTCGKLFSKQNKLMFTISDMGVTIRRNVNDYLRTGRSMPGKDSIEWAVEEGNTTKREKIPGGLGLSLIRDFLKVNGGAIQIVSSDGYWQEIKGVAEGYSLKNTFLGTIVNLEFNLNDNNLYILASEIDPESLF